MKKILLITSALFFLSLTSFISDTPDRLELSGKWKLQIDKKIDGQFSGHQGCPTMIIEQSSADKFVATYEGCVSVMAKDSKFSGQIYTTRRGHVISMIQDGVKVANYYAVWSGKQMENDDIIGLWTDVEGNQGEFRLSRK